MVVAERRRDALALFEIQHDAREVVEERVVFEESARILGDGVEQPSQRRPRLAVERVRVRGRDHVGTGRVHLRVDRERGPVDHRVAFDDVTAVVDADEVGDADVLEVHPERVEPEAVEVLGIAHGDVAGDALVEPELAEQAERCRQALFAVEALLVDRVELGQEAQVGKQRRHDLNPRLWVGGAPRASAGQTGAKLCDTRGNRRP